LSDGHTSEAGRVHTRLARGDPKERERERCVATTRSGGRCPNWPLPGKDRCNLHTGENAKLMGQRGGRRRAIFRNEDLEPVSVPKDAKDLWQFVTRTLIDVRSQLMDTRVANCIFYGTGAALSALQVADLETRLRALEEKHELVQKGAMR
jgi:hypothetical protein